MATVPAHINIAGARLPMSYESAKTALANCASIDECQDWANKAEALASYARQADDDTLRKLADRIQARAVRRCGELLKTFNNERARTDLDKGALTQRHAAAEAGMSLHQQRTAVRVANVPADAFEAAVETDEPLTVTKLADMGRQPRAPAAPVAPAWTPPEGFADATHLLGTVQRFADFCRKHDPARIAGGVMPYEAAAARETVAVIDGWLDRFIVNLRTDT